MTEKQLDSQEQAFLEKAHLTNLNFNFQPKQAKKTDGTLSQSFEKQGEVKTHGKTPRHTKARSSSSAPAPKYARDTEPAFDPKGEMPVRVGCLLGLEQVGQCVFIEYGNDMILMDCGLEFNETITMGADYLIPDITYIKKNIKKLKGIVLTHGHLDHIGALKDILPQLDFVPTIYTTPLTLGLVKKTLEERKTVNNLKYKIIDPDVDLIKLGCFEIEFIRVNHNIPETVAISINTPKGVIYSSADFKIDYTPAIDKPADLAKVARIGTEGVRLYIGDSLGADKPGWSKSEKTIGENLDQMIGNVKGRCIVATFASNVGRVIQIIQSAVKHGRVVFLNGRSLLNYTDVARELGYITAPKDSVRKLDASMDGMHDDKVLLLSTGAQGEEMSALARMSRGEHMQVKIRENDTVILSSSTIPGNETQMSLMINNLLTKGVNVITSGDMDIHTSGHGHEEDHKLMLSLLKPEYFLPYYMPAMQRYAHQKIGLGMGFDPKKVIMPEGNGAVLEMYNDRIILSPNKLKLDTIIVDGKGIGGLTGEYVSKARKMMSESGMLTFILKVDVKTRAMVGNIQIESRGFVYTTEIRKVHTDIVRYVEKEYKNRIAKYDNVKQCLKDIKSDLEIMLQKSLDRLPLIVPMFVYMNGDGEMIEDSAEVIE